MTDQIAIRARIRGKVQGVSFRAWTQGEAQERGLTGRVQNEADGTVTALIEGPRASVEALVTALQDGPPAARVERVDTSEATPEGFAGFEIRR